MKETVTNVTEWASDVGRRASGVRLQASAFGQTSDIVRAAPKTMALPAMAHEAWKDVGARA